MLLLHIHKAIEMVKEIVESKTGMIKWCFTFFSALSLMILGLYLKK